MAAYSMTSTALRWTIKGTNVAYGFSWNNSTLVLQFIYERAPGDWDFVRDPAKPSYNGRFMGLLLVGPGGSTSPADPDGDGGIALANVEAYSFINTHAPEDIVVNYIDDVNRLADAQFGAGAPAPTGPRFQPSNVAAVLAAFDAGLARVQVVGERLVKR